MYQYVAERFVEKFVNDACEFTMDMMNDCPDEYASFKAVEKTMAFAIESFSEACLDDYLNDLCNKIRQELKQKRVEVSSVQIDKDGYKACLYRVETNETE